MNDSFIRHYRDIADLSRQMLNQARADHWDQVLALSKQYVNAVERLRQVCDLTNADRAARRELLVRILDDDAHIRLLAAPELARLGRHLGQLRQGRHMITAYRNQCSPSDSSHRLRKADIKTRP